MGRKRLNKLAKGASDTKNESYPYYGPPAIFSEEGDSVPQHAKPVIRIPKSTLENHKEEDASLGPIRFHTEFVDQGKTLYTLRNEKSVSAFVQGSKTEAPVFDVVTEFSCNSTFGKTMEVEGDVNVFYVASLQGRRRIDIRSPALIAALQRVVRYWPGLILTIATVRVKEPFSLLVHHAEELIAYQEECASRDQLETCEKELDASNHLNLLNQYMEENIMPAIRAERQRHERGFVTFEYLWLLFKPGTDVIVKLREQDQASVTAHDSGVVKSLRGGPGQYKDGIPIGWEVVTFYLGSDGSSIGRVSETTTIPKFEGEMPVSSLPLVPVKWAGESPDGRPWVDVMSGFGAKSFQLLTPQCAMHAGRSMEFPYEDVDGLVMIDYKSFLTEFPDKRPVIAPPLQQTIGVANCNCPVCAKRSVETTHSSTVAFAGYDNIEIGKSKLTDHQAFLFGRCTYAFHFRTRMWQFINVANLTPARFKSDILETLVMKSERMNMLRALAKKYMQPENTIGPRRADFWSADFIEGKGKSQIILLHGRPGVGKTYTAECMAEYTRRPLLTLTCADIGTEPEEIEHNLTYHFGAAKEWGAIVLIDEADIYMERRSSNDLTRNSLVASFLRALETFEGMLFLTTNRVGAFDDAFVSRIHVKLYYPPLEDEDRQKIWTSFIKKLARERMKDIRVTMGAKDYIKGPAIKALTLNGREIRNAFQTAVALAEFEEVRDEEGTVCVEEHHIQQVAEMTREFQLYLQKLHKGDEDKRAERNFERNDQ